MREILNIHIGQCGVQVGSALWELLSLEHQIKSDGKLKENAVETPGEDRAFETFFYETENEQFVPVALLCDLEPTVIDEIRTGPYRQLFHEDQLINGLEDAANNFARGCFSAAKQITEKVVERIQTTMEQCDSPQGFIIYRSLGGGTGSGFTSSLFDFMDEYQKLCRVEFPIYPSTLLASSVVEPYNFVLGQHFCMDDIDISLLFDNDALYQLSEKNLNNPRPTFNDINRILVQVCSSITASCRFENYLYNDVHAMQTNLVPYPRIHFPMSNYSPLTCINKASHTALTVDEITRWVFQRDHQLVSVDPSQGKYMSCSMIYRGDVTPQLVYRALQQVKSNSNLRFVEWVPTGFKVGIVRQPPSTSPGSLLAPSKRNVTMLTNNSAISQAIQRLVNYCSMLYAKRAFVHWFVGEGLEEAEFCDAQNNLQALVRDYEEVTKDLSEKSTTDFLDDKNKQGTEGKEVNKAPDLTNLYNDVNRVSKKKKSSDSVKSMQTKLRQETSISEMISEVISETQKNFGKPGSKETGDLGRNSSDKEGSYPKRVVESGKVFERTSNKDDSQGGQDGFRPGFSPDPNAVQNVNPEDGNMMNKSGSGPKWSGKSKKSSQESDRPPVYPKKSSQPLSAKSTGSGGSKGPRDSGFRSKSKSSKSTSGSTGSSTQPTGTSTTGTGTGTSTTGTGTGTSTSGTGTTGTGTGTGSGSGSRTGTGSGGSGSGSRSGTPSGSGPESGEHNLVVETKLGVVTQPTYTTDPSKTVTASSSHPTTTTSGSGKSSSKSSSSTSTKVKKTVSSNSSTQQRTTAESRNMESVDTGATKTDGSTANKLPSKSPQLTVRVPHSATVEVSVSQLEDGTNTVQSSLLQEPTTLRVSSSSVGGPNAAKNPLLVSVKDHSSKDESGKPPVKTVMTDVTKGQVNRLDVDGKGQKTLKLGMIDPSISQKSTSAEGPPDRVTTMTSAENLFDLNTTTEDEAVNESNNYGSPKYHHSKKRKSSNASNINERIEVSVGKHRVFSQTTKSVDGTTKTHRAKSSSIDNYTIDKSNSSATKHKYYTDNAVVSRKVRPSSKSKKRDHSNSNKNFKVTQTIYLEQIVGEPVVHLANLNSEEESESDHYPSNIRQIDSK